MNSGASSIWYSPVTTVMMNYLLLVNIHPGPVDTLQVQLAQAE